MYCFLMENTFQRELLEKYEKHVKSLESALQDSMTKILNKRLVEISNEILKNTK